MDSLSLSSPVSMTISLSLFASPLFHPVYCVSPTTHDPCRELGIRRSLSGSSGYWRPSDEICGRCCASAVKSSGPGQFVALTAQIQRLHLGRIAFTLLALSVRLPPVSGSQLSTLCSSLPKYRGCTVDASGLYTTLEPGARAPSCDGGTLHPTKKAGGAGSAYEVTCM